MDQFAQAGFLTKDIGNGKNELMFKKFIRVKKDKTSSSFMAGVEDTGKAEYVTYQLVQVQRKEGDAIKTYTGPEMTVEGELIPRGTYGIYTNIDTVGTSNSTGVANLGARPTKDQILETINEKLKKDNDDQTPLPPSPDTPTGPITPTAPVSPAPIGEGTTIESGIFAGMTIESFDPNDFGGGNFFINENDVDDVLKDIDGCSK